MPSIYEPNSNTTLGDFIEDVRNINSNIVIPDLQRPYIWNPDQVILLIDSIFKKWPFGSLLCWNVKNNEHKGSFIPHRPFWSNVIRNVDKEPQMLSYNASSDTFLMILDGQQRIQSLLLALGGASWGFTLPDKDWKKILEDTDESIDPKHWSSGCLCLNIEKFLTDYSNRNNKIAGIEVGKCLEWAVTCENGVSDNNKKHPLPVTDLCEGKYIRFSRLWDLAEPSVISESDYCEKIKNVFQEIPEEKLQTFINPIAQFMHLISDVKYSTKITQLIVNDFERSGLNDRSIYNNAIVNIFARLNTAGRALTTEEITLAWLKTGWREENNRQSSNIDCASELNSLLSELNDNSINGESGMQMKMDDLVNILSYFWIILTRDGNNKKNLLLGDKDYVNGDIMKDIGITTYKYWEVIREAILFCKEKFENRKLSECFSRSFKAFYIICCWRFITELSYIQNEGTVRNTECKFTGQINGSFDNFIDRWYFETMLTETWSNTDNFTNYISKLCILYSKIKNNTDVNYSINLLNNQLKEFLQDLLEPSKNRINSIRAHDRMEVLRYKNLLWFWNRLTNERFNETQKPMKRKNTSPKWEVDHSIPVKIWGDKVESRYPLNSSIDKATGQENQFVIAGNSYTRSSLLTYINVMGNCSLLLRSHNRSKKDEPLGDFLRDIYNNDENIINEIKRILDFDDCLLSPDNQTIEDIIKSIDKRTKIIKDDLIKYISNGLQREDI